jgi:hypothetical protein
MIYNWTRASNDAKHNDAAELALANSPALTYFQASIWNQGSGLHPDLREAACKRIIANAPNLRYASVTRGRSGCVVRVLSAPAQADLLEKEEFFYTQKKPNASLKALTLDGYALSRQTLDQWGRFLDFSKLESLKCSRGYMPNKSYFDLAPGHLSGLKRISLNFTCNDDPEIAAAAENYLATCPPLETISLWSWMNVVTLPTIMKHGSTLKTLQLHERESMNLDVARGLLTATDVVDIRRMCPMLKDLTMDIDREAEEWEEEVGNRAIYSELGLFGPQLDKIQIYFNLGIAARIAGVTWRSGLTKSNKDIPQTKRSNRGRGLSTREKALLPMPSPMALSDQVRSIWATIFGHRRTGERALDVKIGEWERKMGGGYPANWRLWEQSNRSFIQLRPHERDDMLDQVVLTCQGGLQGRI